MAASAINSLMKTGPSLLDTATRSPLMDRFHYGGSSEHGSYHDGYSYSSKSSSKNRIALSALTLLAFLFFLNILQNCLQDQMTDMTQNQVIVMSARDEELAKKESREGPASANVTLRNAVAERLQGEIAKKKVEQIDDMIRIENPYPY